MTSFVPSYFFQIWHHLSSKRRRQTFLILCLMIISAVTEVLSLGAIVPFVAVLFSPDTVFNIPYIASMASYFGIFSANQIILPLTLIFISLAIIAGGVRIFFLWASSRLAANIGSDFSVEAFKRTLYQPYSVHTNRNSSEVISTLIAKVTSATTVINLVLNTICSIIISVFIIIALTFIAPIISSTLFVIIGITYLIISRIVKSRIMQNSVYIDSGYDSSLKAIKEGLEGIRDVILGGVQSIYYEKYSKLDRRLRIALGDNLFLIGSPRFLIETFGMVVLVIIAYRSSLQPQGLEVIMPTLAALALGAQRLLPSIQRVYSGINGVRGHKDSLISVLNLLEQKYPANMQLEFSDLFEFKTSVQFDSVYFGYGKNNWSLKDLKFDIKKGDIVAIVGKTGSGKSTLVDLLLGLLSPDKGKILVDGIPVTGQQLYSWQNSISHVPQNIYLADTTIAENIAFGVKKENIDLDRVKSVARCANIDIVVSGYPDGYETIVGENGIFFSGGQRQRLGIARALYKKSHMLILDEATSALDTVTEKLVLNSIKNFNTNITIIMITHRTSTVLGSNKVIELEEGQIKTFGSYNHVVKTSSSFRGLIQDSKIK